MKLAIRSSFLKDIKKIKDKQTLKKIYGFITEFEKRDFRFEELLVYKIKKLTGNRNYFRIKIRNYRIGTKIIGNNLELIRVLHRKDIYKFLPY